MKLSSVLQQVQSIACRFVVNYGAFSQNFCDAMVYSWLRSYILYVLCNSVQNAFFSYVRVENLVFQVFGYLSSVHTGIMLF